MLRQFQQRSLGLRNHALLVCTALFFLTVLLGTRAYSVARSQSRKISELVHYEMRAEGLLVRMEAIASAQAQAQRKLKVTRDPAYIQLVEHQAALLDSNVDELRQTLTPVYPDLASRNPATPAEIAGIRAELNMRRQAKLNQANDDASGLLGSLALALSITMAITAWLLILFYRGLVQPLARMKEATTHIREGELSFRIPQGRGVAELRELSVSFNRMAERLEALDSAKSEFLATVSHEVKNPLAALKEGLNLLSTRGDELPPSSRGKAFAACVIASKRLEWMINNMLQHSRMETGLYRFDLTQKDLNAAIQTAVDEVRPLAERKGMSIRMASEPVEASFNWEGMVQVFENLLLNAIKYGKEESPIDIELRSTDRSLRNSPQEVPHVEVSVSNNGQTIPETEVSRLFDRFFRGGNSSQQNGLGLGLHVVRRIVEAHHGEVAADSKDGKTRIQVWIPHMEVFN